MSVCGYLHKYDESIFPQIQKNNWLWKLIACHLLFQNRTGKVYAIYLVIRNDFCGFFGQNST